MLQTFRHQAADAPCEVTVEVNRDISALRETWRGFQKHALGGPHDTWEWNKAWARTAGMKLEPIIVIGRDEAGKLLFLLPFAIRRRKGCTVLEWLGAEQGNYASGLFHPTAWQERALPQGQALMDLILTHLPGVDAVHLSAQPDEIANKPNPLSALPSVEAASSGHTFALTPDWEAHFNQMFSARQRSRIRNCVRNLSEHSSVDFREVVDPSERLLVLDHMIVEKRQWFAEKGIPDFFEKKEMGDFFHSLTHMTETGDGPSLRIYSLRSGDQIVATNMGLSFQNRFYGLIATTTSGPLRRYSPGRIVFLRLVEQLAREGIEMIDCGAGEDDDKLRWCTDERIRRDAIIPVSLKGYVYAMALRLVLTSKRNIKQSPCLWCWAQRIRQWKSVFINPPAPSRTATGSRVPGLQA